MQKNEMLYFLNEIFLKGWNPVLIIIEFIGFAGGIIGLFKITDFNTKSFLYIGGLVFFLTFIFKLIKQLYLMFQTRPIRALQLIKGDGLFLDQQLIILETSIFVTKDLLLTLFCCSSGIRQPISIIKVVDIDLNKDRISAIQVIDKSKNPINTFFEEEARRINLYAIPSIDFQFLNAFFSKQEVVDEE